MDGTRRDTAAPVPDGRTVPPAPGAGGAHDACGARHPRTARSVLARLRVPHRPHLWFEVLLIVASYWIYSMIRSAVPEQRGTARQNATWLFDLEQQLGIAVEGAVNRAVNSQTWLIVGMNYYYATLHFAVTICVLIWLYRRHPGRYSAARLVLLVTTASALVGYYLYPLAPPRLISHGFVDTLVVHHTWGSLASHGFRDVSNQYAAMPSMHVGWALWCGLTVFALSKAPWARILALLYPAVTVLVIVATANHFWLDAVGGMLCLAVGYAVARWWYGALPYALPRLVPAARAPSVAPARASAPAAGQGPAGPRGASLLPVHRPGRYGAARRLPLARRALQRRRTRSPAGRRQPP